MAESSTLGNLNDNSNIADWLPEFLTPAWMLVNDYPLLGALAVICLFYFAAYIVRYFLLKSLERILQRTESNIDNHIVLHLRKPIFTTLLYFGFALATEASGIEFGRETLINLFLSVIVVSWIRASFIFSTSLLTTLSNNELRFSIVESQTVPMLDLTIKLIVILLGSYSLLIIWGINPMGWLASAGIVGIAVGFAAKDTLANLFSGFFILIDRPYKIGDYINLDSGERGRVTHVGLRSSRILTRDDIEIIVPNALIANGKIVNESGGPALTIRTKLMVGVAYGSNVDKVCDILEQIAREHSEVVGDPYPRVRMRGFGPSSLDFELQAWIEKPENRGRIQHDLFMTIYKAFAKEGIEIPYNKTDVYIKEFPNIKDK